MNIIYTAKATATGGRNGHIKSVDGSLDVEVRSPKEMGGGSGTFLNPEILFAGGYAACFDNALKLIIRTEHIEAGTTSVTAAVGIGKNDHDAYGFDITLEIEIPGVDHEKAVYIAEKAHTICPYSNATRGNIDVQIVVK